MAEGISFLPAHPWHTGDNAGMIAFAAWIDPMGCDRSARLKLRVNPSASLG
jgi:N6-L-threonylcarbamoyladenine synthase